MCALSFGFSLVDFWGMGIFYIVFLVWGFCYIGFFEKELNVGWVGMEIDLEGLQGEEEYNQNIYKFKKVLNNKT